MRYFNEQINKVATECFIADGGVSDLTDAIKASITAPEYAGRRKRGQTHPDYYLTCGGWDWVGRDFSGRTAEQVCDACNGVWTEGMRLFDQCYAEIQDEELPTPQRASRRRRWDQDNGDGICLDRMRAGQDYWQSTHREQSTGPQTITLVCNQGALANYDSEDIMWRGLATVILADKLEAAGYRVEIISASHATRAYADNRTSALTVINQKSAFDPLDRVALINATSGWFFRTVIFASRGLTQTRKFESGSIGYTASLEPAMHIIAPHSTSESRILIEGFYTRQKCLQFLRETLATFTERAMA